jgi:hypothetical protein
MTVRRRHEYSDTWEQFVNNIYDYLPGHLAGMFEQLAWDEKVGMILAMRRLERENRELREANAMADSTAARARPSDI